MHDTTAIIAPKLCMVSKHQRQHDMFDEGPLHGV
jgi:hypothetical protein